jgi:hypothetical protein
MTPLPAVPNVVKAQLLWSDSADITCYNGLFFSYSGSGPDAADCHDFLLALVTALGSHNGLWTSTTMLLGGTATDLSSSSGAQGVVNVSYDGDLSGGDLAGGTALVASYTLNRRYRGGKPRNYFPWGSSTSLETRQAWNSGFVDSSASAINATITSVLGETYGGMTIQNHVNVSYYEGSRVVTSPTTGRARNVPIPRADPLVNPITGLSILGRPGSQRRRNRV